MNRKGIILNGIILLTIFIEVACKQPAVQHGQENTKPAESSKTEFVVNEQYLPHHTDSCRCAAQFELEDSLKLKHIKDQFYTSKTGHLYEKTIGLKEINGHLADHEYFNGYFLQKVDPLSFEPLDGWYAKDKHNVYYYRPVSGGMQLSKMDEADCKTFHMLAGHYKYAKDKNHFYDETQVINGFTPVHTKVTLDKKGRAVEMTCRGKKFTFEIVSP